MTENHSKPRQLAELAFSKTQSQFLARERVQEEIDTVAAARDEKTIRLREARFAKERQDNLQASGMPLAKPINKR
jgi:hypothetical protein